MSVETMRVGSRAMRDAVLSTHALGGFSYHYDGSIAAFHFKYQKTTTTVCGAPFGPPMNSPYMPDASRICLDCWRVLTTEETSK